MRKILLENTQSLHRNSSDKGKGPWGLLRGVLLLQLAGALWLAVIAVSGLWQAAGEPLQDLIGLAVMAVIGVAWVLAPLLGSLLYAPWARAAALTVQVGCFAIGLGMLQGLLGPALWALPVLCLAVCGGYAAVKVRPQHTTVDDDN